MSFVIDASAVANRWWLVDSVEQVYAPHLIDLEITEVLRKEVLRGNSTADNAAVDIEAWSVNDVVRCDHQSYVSRIWELRHNISAYDASYVALAEHLKVPLITADRRLAKAAAPYCDVVLVD